MTNKYYLSIEIRYSYTAFAGEEDEAREHENKYIASDLFDTFEACMEYGNKIIEANNWTEQYPGYVGGRLKKQFNLVAPSLKNGAQIFIKVKTLNINDAQEINAELQKFNIPKINGKI